jgi:hypothetical protein
MKLLLALAAAGIAYGQTPFQCVANAPIVRAARAEGKAELVGDVVVSCTGGTPTAFFEVIPSASFTLTYNSTVTSKSIAPGRSEALLLLDEPATDAQYPCTQSLCIPYGNGQGAGYYGPFNPNQELFGVSNIFSGVSSGSTITWTNIPVDPPGSQGARIFRFTNVRLDAGGAKAGLLTLTGVANSAQIPIQVTGTPAVANVQPGLAVSVRDAANSTAVGNGVGVALAQAGSTATRVATLRFSGQYTAATRPQTIATPGNPDAVPAPAAQNVPGAVYPSESGFYNPSLPTVNGVDLSSAGLANWGTRLMATFTNLPANVTVYVTLRNEAGAVINAPMARLTATAADGSGAFSALPGNNSMAPLTTSQGTATAVWEILSNGISLPNNFDFGVYVAYPAGITMSPSPVAVKMGYAPIVNGVPAFSGATGSQTIFSFTTTTPPPPPVLSVSPAAITFTATVGGQNPPAQQALVTSTANITAYNAVSGSVIPAAFQPQSGSTPAQTSISVNTRGMDAGTYRDTIKFVGAASTASLDVTLILAPRPVVTTLGPSSAVAGSGAFTLTVAGTNLTRGTTVLWNGTPLPTTFASSTSLSAQVPAALIATPGDASIAVLTPDGSQSVTLTLPVIALSLTSITPSTVLAGSGAFTIRAAGSGFLQGALLNVGSASIQPTTVTSSLITATVPASAIAQAGSLSVTVTNPGGSVSNALTLTATEPAVLTSISPDTRTATGSAFVLDLRGSGFAPNATVQLAGATLTPSTTGRTQLTVSVPASAIAQPGALSVRVVNSATDSSNALTLSVNPAPRITVLTPSSLTVGGSGPLAVAGTNLQGCTIYWNGQPISTTGVSGAELQTLLTPAMTATGATATVTAVTADGVSSNSLTFTVVPTATITALNPAVVNVGSGAFTLTVTGSNLPSGASVVWNGQSLPTTVLSATQATAQVPASLTAAIATAQIAISNESGATSNSMGLRIVLPPLPDVGFTAPGSAGSGQDQPITLTLGGSYPVDLNGTLTLAFTPDSGLPDDPAIQFQNGSRAMTFTIPAGAPAQIPAVLTKTGTLTGVITVTVTFSTPAGDNLTPPNVVPVRITIGRSAPSISSVTCSRNPSGFTVVVDGYTNTREAAQAMFDFTAATGASLGTTQLLVQTGSLFTGWFGSSGGASAGGVFRYTQPFTVQGTATNIAGLSVRLGNSAGASPAASCQLQ